MECACNISFHFIPFVITRQMISVQGDDCSVHALYHAVGTRLGVTLTQPIILTHAVRCVRTLSVSEVESLDAVGKVFSYITCDHSLASCLCGCINTDAMWVMSTQRYDNKDRRTHNLITDVMWVMSTGQQRQMGTWPSLRRVGCLNHCICPLSIFRHGAFPRQSVSPVPMVTWFTAMSFIYF